MFSYDDKYMRRALELAAHGFGNTSPNPMVGSVITTSDGRIIGEGYHRRCGEAHAEVNAIRSVRTEDRRFLKDSTMYVTLEPCSHYGKTPPCARLIIDTGIPRVVIAARDPFKEVSGRGIRMLEEAGVRTITGVLEPESRRLNARFMTAHTERRAFITLKWAQSADGFMDRNRTINESAARFSTPVTSMIVHRLRAAHDAILAGSGTVIADRPSLTTRLWPGRSPRPVIADRRGRCDLSSFDGRKPLVITSDTSPESIARELYREGITSILVEGGAALLGSFIDAGMWDAAQIETAGFSLGREGRIPAPVIHGAPIARTGVDGNVLRFYSNNPLVTSDSLLCPR